MKRSKFTLLFLGVLLLFLAAIWYCVLTFFINRTDQAKLYIPQSSEAIVRVNMKRLKEKAVLTPLLSRGLSEEKRKLVFSNSERISESGVRLTDELFLTIENRNGNQWLLVYLNISDPTAFEKWVKAKKWTYVANDKVGILAFSTSAKERGIQSYLDTIINKKIKPIHFENFNNNGSKLATIRFLKENLTTTFSWDNKMNALQIKGSIPNYLDAFESKLKPEANAFYAAFPLNKAIINFLKYNFKSKSLNTLKSVRFVELNYWGSKVDVLQQMLFPNAELVIHFKQIPSENIHSWLEKSNFIQVENDSTLMVEKKVHFNYKIDSNRLFLFNHSVRERENGNQSFAFRTKGNTKVIFNFYNNAIVNLLISGQPTLKQIRFLANSITQQSIEISSKEKGQQIDGEIRFNQAVDVPFELLYLLKSIEE